MRLLLPAALLVLLVSLAMPAVSAHAAPPPRPFETRILHDHNDDSAIVLAGKHGFDAIALDVREAKLPAGDDVLVLRLLLNGGCSDEVPTDCPTLREVVTFEGPGGAQEITFETVDGGLTWTGNAAKYVGPEALNDGTRFAIEAWVPFAAFGGTAGSSLTSWFVEGYEGENTADDMPAGVLPGLPDPLGAAFDAGSYTLGSRDYIQLETASTNLTGLAGSVVEVAVQLTNLVGLEQDASLLIQGPAVLADGGLSGVLALAPNFTADLSLNVTLPNGTAPVNLTVSTPLGGFALLTFMATGDAPEPVVDANATEDDHDHEDEKDTPAPTPALLVGAVMLTALALRRRR